MIAQSIMILLLSIFALGCSAIIVSQVNIIGRSYSAKKRHRQQQLAKQPLALKVIERNELSPRHFSVRLQAMNGVALPNFLPGQYLTLMPQDSLKRCYSLASWEKETQGYELGIQREVEGKASSWLYDNLQVGAVINTLPPKGNFVFNAKKSQHTVLIAGGIGITPLRAMVHQFIAYQAFTYESVEKVGEPKSMTLFYSAKSIDEMCYVDEFVQLADEFSNFMFYPFVTTSSAGRLSVEKLNQKLEFNLDLDPKDYNYYLCGPNAMMDDITNGLTHQGIAVDNIHCERFGIEASSFNNQDFSIQIGSNKSFVFNKQRTLLDAMESQGIEIESECRSGECGQCKVNLLAGKVKPLINIELDLKTGEILPCCSIPKSDLLIEL